MMTGKHDSFIPSYMGFLKQVLNLDLLSHISPVSWENIILYGGYILNRNKVMIP